MQCDYHDTGRCRSCSLLHLPYADQVAGKQSQVAQTLDEIVPRTAWSEPCASAPSGFRNKAKLVAGGNAGALTLGILDARGRGVDLRDCELYEPPLSAAIPVIAAFAEDARLVPYDVPQRRGELKHVLVTVAPGGQLMIRFVLRSTHHLAGLRSRLSRLVAELPGTQVVSVNIQPEHKAVLEGEREIVLTTTEALRMPVNDIALFLRPGSFFQTNTAVAAALYRQAREWIAAVAPASVWDLYCGVGGFALHALAPGRTVAGVEVSAAAIGSARQALAEIIAHDPEAGRAEFVVGDAAGAAEQLGERRGGGLPGGQPGLVVVNPPRRGIDPGLAAWLENSSADHLIYSSCNPVTLARDLMAMSSRRVRAARLFDMFPQTGHHEIAVLCSR